MPTPKVRLNKDVLSGVLFAAFGGAFLWLARDYGMGSGRRMGPGLFPSILSAALMVVGVVIILRGWAIGSGPVGKIAWRGVGCVLGATVLFGLLLRGAGLLPAVLCLVLVSACGSQETRRGEVLLLALGLAVSTVVIFVYGLGLPLRIVGPLLGG